MPRPIEALIHTSALAHNLARARLAAPDSRVFAVVKADAYGHGIARAFDGLRGADGFALLDLAEAERIRGLGWRGPVLLLEGCFEPRDLELCSRLDLWPVVHRDDQIDWIAAHKSQRALSVFLKLDSGMNRLGFPAAAYRAAWARLAALPQVDQIVLMTHFANADADGGTDAALARFRAATSGLDGPISLANSAATLRGGPSVHGDWIRAGIMLYGSSPDHPAHGAGEWGLEPAMTLRTRLIAVRDLAPGDPVGYGSTHVARRAQRIGIAACGYADGYPRVAPGGTPVLVDGLRCASAGRVSMDMIAVDLEAAPAAGMGSEVTLWGRGPGGSLLPIDEVAHAAGTLGYELMCALAPRVPVRVEDARP